jgi:hypothetical protein
MSRAVNWSAEELRAFEAAVPPSVARDIAAHSSHPGPSTAGSGGTISSVAQSRPSTGYVRPLGPPPGVAACDRLMDAADARDRHDLIVEHARRAAERKLAKGE